ncbi:hypothetical protein D3C85_1247980 [compost metagenome]
MFGKGAQLGAHLVKWHQCRVGDDGLVASGFLHFGGSLLHAFCHFDDNGLAFLGLDGGWVEGRRFVLAAIGAAQQQCGADGQNGEAIKHDASLQGRSCDARRTPAGKTA